MSSSIHLAGLLLGYSKTRLLDSTHDLHSHVDASHMTQIRDRYDQLDSTYTINQPHDAARALEMILQSNLVEASVHVISIQNVNVIRLCLVERNRIISSL